MTSEQETAAINERATLDLERLRGKLAMQDGHREEVRAYTKETRRLVTAWRVRLEKAMKETTLTTEREEK